nr:unnamed protein product [Callosobruchus analis]
MSQHPDVPSISILKERLSKSEVRRNRSHSKFYSCVQCSRTFNTKTLLDEHLLRRHPKLAALVSSKIHECTDCDYKSTNKSNFEQHRAVHNNTVYKVRKCKYCDAKFNCKPSLLGHILKQHPEFIEAGFYKVHECKNCHYKSAYNRDLKRHISRVHPDAISESISCKYCKARFKSDRLLESHIARAHLDAIAKISTQFECFNCTFKCFIKTDLESHMVKNHARKGTVKMYSCLECPFKTGMKGYLEKHVLGHRGVDSTISVNKCAHCKAVYMSKKLLDAHILSKHPEFVTSVSSKILKCTSCDYKTTTKTTLFNHIVQNHPSFASSVTSKVYECSKCSYKTTRRYLLDRHLLNHADVTSKFQLSKCERCNVTFKGKQLRDAHILKEHPNFIGSVTSRIHECTNCNYKTTSKPMLDNHVSQRHTNLATPIEETTHECSQCQYKTEAKSDFDEHMLTHSNVASDLNPCEHCDMSFKHKAALYNHVIKRHPETTDSIPGKILECSSCTYKTTRKVNLKKHELLHTDPDPNFTCMRCDATFRTMRPFGDHVIKHHPNFIASISCKVHECVHCEYKTTYANNFAKHLTEHTGETTTKLYPCKHCHAIFKSKQSMDDHVLRKHPDLIATVTSKLHTCKYCTYKTTLQTNLAKHVADHTEIFGKLFPCAHCVSSFKTKQSLDNHILKKHADFNSSVSCTVYQCDKCPYITAFRHCLTNHNCRNV